jgi:hypothetical protein
MKSAFIFLLKFQEKRCTTFVHKVPRLVEYLGLRKCWAPPGKVLLYTGNFATGLLLTLVRSIPVRRQVRILYSLSLGTSWTKAVNLRVLNLQPEHT